jgi:hypothetical protein
MKEFQLTLIVERSIIIGALPSGKLAQQLIYPVG